MSGQCFICEFLSGNPVYEHILIHETHDAVAFLDKYPTMFGCTLVAPKRHVEQVTGDFSEQEYLELQKLVHRVSEAIRSLLSPERVYILSLGSQLANSHVHWHISPLPHGVPLEKQQYRALMHEHGTIVVTRKELEDFAADLRSRLQVPE